MFSLLGILCYSNSAFILRIRASLVVVAFPFRLVLRIRAKIRFVLRIRAKISKD